MRSIRTVSAWKATAVFPNVHQRTAPPRQNVAIPHQRLPFSSHSVSQQRCSNWGRRCVRVKAQAVATAIKPETTVKVSFKLPYRCHFGQNVYLIGAGQELGNWNVEDSRPMKWSAGDIWVVEVELGAGSKPHQLEYKYVVLNPDGTVSAWKPGNNCKVEVSDENAKINVFDAWDGAIHDVQVMLPRPTPQDFNRLAAVAAATAPINKQLPPGLDGADVAGNDTIAIGDTYQSVAEESDRAADTSASSDEASDADLGIGTQIPIPNPLAKFEPTGSALDDFPITTRWLYTPPRVDPPSVKPTTSTTSPSQPITAPASPSPSADNVTSFPIDPVEEIEGYVESISNFASSSSSSTWRSTSTSEASPRRPSRFGSLDTDDSSSTEDVGSTPPVLEQPLAADIGGLPMKPTPPPVFAPGGGEESSTLSQLAMVLSERNAVESAMKRALQEIDLHLQESMDLGGKLSDPAHETRLEMDRKLAAANMRVNAYTKVLNACPPVKELQAAIELERKESQP